MSPLFLFRGTTVGFKGNKAAITVPYTSTSTHPVKALWFGLECLPRNPSNAVIYLANIEDLAHLKTMQNFLASVEDELAFRIKPEKFYPFCEGYVHVTEMQGILGLFGIDGYQIVTKKNITFHCEVTPPLSRGTVDLIVAEMRKKLKK
ncbi:MAG TPA: hypothetical protein VL978_17590 [Puia sp.]|nr:hypothetical protein [Puia sp.]